MELLRLLKNNTPFIDLRSPKEFEQGALPTSYNFPILNNDERHQIGIKYKEYGNSKAVQFGLELVQGDKRKSRIESWRHFLIEHPNAYLYCWRGGQRSKIAGEWLKDIGIDAPIIKGGFKALRNLCLDILHDIKNDNRVWFILGGKTGSGKTKIIHSLDNGIDLEGLANHKGSAFGGDITLQPTHINFEHTLAVDLLNIKSDTLVIEDESRTIGRLVIPNVIFQRMKNDYLVILDVPLQIRLNNIFNEYITAPLNNGISPLQLKHLLTHSLHKIKNRLGGQHFTSIYKKIEDSFSKHITSSSHKAWISELLIHYYDPIYNYQLNKKKHRCIFKGNRKDVSDFLDYHSSRNRTESNIKKVLSGPSGT